MPQYPPLTEVELPLLVTGIAGVAGLNAFKYYRAKYPGQVIGIRRDDQMLRKFLQCLSALQLQYDLFAQEAVLASLHYFSN